MFYWKDKQNVNLNPMIDLDAEVEKMLNQCIEKNSLQIKAMLLENGATKEELPELIADIKESTRLDLLKQFEEKLRMTIAKEKSRQINKAPPSNKTSGSF